MNRGFMLLLKFVFQPPADLLTAFQNRLVDFITNPILGQGQAQVIPPDTIRVDFEAVNSDLMGN